METVDDLQDEDDNNDDNTLSLSVMKKMRRIIAYFNKSLQAQEQLEKCMEEENGKRLSLVQDVVTQWWSTLQSVERMLEVKKSLQKFFGDNDSATLKKWASKEEGGGYKLPLPLSADEWTALVQLTTLLRPFKTAQKQLSASRYVTYSIAIPMIDCIEENLNALEEEVYFNSTVSSLVKDMKAKFHEHFGSVKNDFFNEVQRGLRRRQVGLHPAFYKAYALDPRSKKLGCLTDDCKKRVWSAILVELTNLGAPDQNEASTPTLASPRQKNMHRTEDTDWMDKFDEDLESPRLTNSDSVSWTTKVKIELQEYQEAIGLPYRTQDKAKVYDPLMDWWKQNSTKYPNVWRLAKLYLGFPASASDSERAFSIAGLIVTPKASVIDPGNVDDMHFLHQNWDYIFQ